MSKVTITVSLSALGALLDGQTKPMLLDILGNLVASPEAARVEANAAPVASAVVSVADKVQAFLDADTSGYDWRSAKEIGQGIGHSTSEVERAVRDASRFNSRTSVRPDVGLLIQVRD